MLSSFFHKIPLDTLEKNQNAIIRELHFNRNVSQNEADSEALDMERKLLEFGFYEGASIKILHFGPIGRDPMIVLLHENQIIALRKREAKAIFVEVISP